MTILSSIYGSSTISIASSISDGDTTHAPNGNSVFDALALKASLSGATLTGATVNALTPTALSIGFTLAGGTTSKTLTVDETVALSAKAPLTSPALITPNLGTPSAGVLTACTTATAADNTATTALATTAYAKSQDAVLARLPDQAVNMTYAASGSSGITVADNDNIDFGTGNFTLVWRGSLPDWTPGISILLLGKGNFVLYVLTTNKMATFLPAGVGSAFYYQQSNANTIPDATIAEIVWSITRETVSNAGNASLYINGVLDTSLTIQANTHGSLSSTNPLYVMGDSDARNAGTCSFAATYNRALTAAEVLALYRNGISYSDKWGSQTAITSGTLVVGYKYRINTYVSDDDFTNIGGTNVTGNEFIATGTTPTHWAHSSSLVKIGATLALEPEGIQNNLWYDSSSNALNASYPATGWSLTRKLNVPRVNTAQPAFLVKPASVQENIAVGSRVVVVWGTEIFDQSNNFASNALTAPMTGKYALFGAIYLNNTVSTYYLIELVTSNRRHSFAVDLGALVRWNIPFLILADMDIGDTAQIEVYQGSGTQQVDIGDESYFSGHLVC